MGPIRLDEEVRTIGWIHGEVEEDRVVPLLAAETVAISLSATMHAQRGLVLPLLTLKEYDQYTMTHSCNVAVLSMGLAERLGLGATTARRFGVAGLLHDIGKVRIPHDLLVKPGRHTDQERDVIRRHPVDGARIILEQPNGSELAAVVAYEHHIFLDGRGYPTLQFPRSCHYASRIVHVCDIYDALCTERPYRKAWSPDEAAAYIEANSGTELDPAIATAFGAMIREAEVQRLPLPSKDAGEPPGVVNQ
jgi:putative nucleotidyltransferase with HDIG domain